VKIVYTQHTKDRMSERRIKKDYDGLYLTKVYLYTTSGGTAYNDLIEFYYVG
jgi:hypothetical protein